MAIDLQSGEHNLYLYACAWLVTFVAYQARRRRFDAGSVLLASYFAYSIASLLLFRSEYFPFDPIRLFPFVYLFLMLMVAFSPVLRYDPSKIDGIRKPANIFLLPVCAVFIIASIAQLPAIVSGFAVSIVRLITTPTGGLDLYNEAMSESYSLGDGSISNLASIISNAYGNFGVLLLFYYLTLEKQSKLIVVGLVISCLAGIVQNVTLGQRGPIQEAMFAFVITYFALRRFYTPAVNRAVKLVGLGTVIAASIPLVYLTVSRFGDMQDGPVVSTYFYVGQQNLFFNNYGLDNNGIRYGDRTVPLFKRMVGMEDIPKNFWERRDKYPGLHISDEVFIGFVGDFTLDYGPLIPPLLFAYLATLVVYLTRVRNGTMQFHQLILLHFVMSVCMLGGIKLYPFSDVGGNLQLIVYVLAYLYFATEAELSRKYRALRSRPASPGPEMRADALSGEQARAT